VRQWARGRAGREDKGGKEEVEEDSPLLFFAGVDKWVAFATRE
jgi:hypothetical protein